MSETAIQRNSQDQHLAQEQRKPTIKDLLEQAKPKIVDVIPKHLDADKLMRVALVTISKNPTLGKCSPQSLLTAFMDSAQLGLELNGSLGLAYLVPYWNSKENCYDAQMIIGYRGLVKLARQSGNASRIDADVVRQGDQFELYYEGSETKFRHVPRWDPSAPIVGAWARVSFSNGEFQARYMPKEDIDNIRKRSKAKDGGPWVTDYAEMCKKTPLRQLCKMIDLSPEVQETMEKLDKREFGGEAMIDVTTVPNVERPNRLKALAQQPEVIDQPDAQPEQQNANGIIDVGLTAKQSPSDLDAESNYQPRNEEDGQSVNNGPANHDPDENEQTAIIFGESITTLEAGKKYLIGLPKQFGADLKSVMASIGVTDYGKCNLDDMQRLCGGMKLVELRNKKQALLLPEQPAKTRVA